MKRARSLWTSAFGLLLALSAAAQTPQFRAGVDLVQLDVSVLDKKTRLPVRGLTAADFTVLEDGNPQTVAAFSFVDIPDTPPAPMVAEHRVTWMREIAPDVQTNAAAGKPDSRLIVLLIDDAMIPFEPWVVQQTKKAARSVIEKLSPSDRVAVVLSAESIHAQDFTSDRARMLAAVERIRPGYATYFFGWDDYQPPVPGAFQPPVRTDNDIALRESSVGTLTAVAEALMAAPDRRKILVYVSPGVPVNAAWAATIRLANGSGLHSFEANKKLVGELPELFRRMQRANVTIYPIDPTGIAGMKNVIEGALNSLPAVRLGLKAPIDPGTGQIVAGALGPDGKVIAPDQGVPFPDQFCIFAAKLDLDFLVQAAAQTGGRAIVNTDDLEPGIKEMFAENSSYYLLGYSPPAKNPPGTMHRITVGVNRPDVEVRTRSGYFTPKLDKVDPTRPSPSPAAQAVGGVLPVGNIPLRAAVAPIGWPMPADPRKGKAAPALQSSVAIVLGLQRPAEAKPLLDTVDVQISAFTPDGVSRGSSSQLATVAIRRAATSDLVRYEALSHIELKPGRYQLRIAAYSGLSDATGSVYADVEVPDFIKDPLSLSGVLLDMNPPPPSAPRDTLAAIAPIVPTAEREFQKLDRASAFVRIYQGGGDPAVSVGLTTRIVDERDATIVNKTETLPPDRFAGATRFADYRFDLPMVTLARGEYLLTFEAVIGKVTKKRDVRFTVK
jgi:VWFA-related protein